MFELDYETVDRYFECDIRLGIFDKRILLSWGDVAHGCQQELNFEDLTRMVERGWIPMLSNDTYPEGNGFPLYVPSRIDMLLELEREGYSTEELQIIATNEEWWIDNFYTVHDLAYLDDDLETVVRYLEELLQVLETGTTRDASGEVLDRSHERYVCEHNLRTFKKFQKEGVPERSQQRVARYAYHVRAHNEGTRIWHMEMDRAKIRSHYSPCIVCHGYGYNFNDGITYTAKGIDWEMTIPSALAHAVSDTPTIRVPGFLLRGDKVVSMKTLTPSEYAQLWRQHDLDQYLFTWSEVQGEKRCLNCHTKLPDTSNGRKKFCSEKCRNASKQKRYRERHPAAVQEAQRKYWSSI